MSSRVLELDFSDVASDPLGVRMAAHLSRELREYAKARLPDHMVPSSIVVLDELPLNAAGKVDTAKLARLATTRSESGTAFVAPRDRREQRLAAICCELLALDRVGARDDFFELGGDSILAIQLVSRAAQEGIRLSSRLVFECPTIAELAEHADERPPLVIEQGPVEGGYPATPVQRWLLDQQLPAPMHRNQGFLFAAREPLDAGVLARAFDALAFHHDALRTRLCSTSSAERLEILPPFEDPERFAVIALDPRDADDRGLALERACADVQGSLDLERGRGFRARLIDLGARGQRLLILAHHLVVDGLSWRILLEDFHRAYAQLTRGQAVVFPAKTSSFRDWALRLDAHVGSGALAEEEDFWLRQIPTEQPRLRLASDGLDLEADAAELKLELSPELTEELVDAAPRALRAEFLELLVLAAGRAIASWNESPVVDLQMEGHGREELFDDVDVSRTVGWFASLWPLRLDFRGCLDLPDGLVEVKDRMRVVPLRGIGFGLLRHGSRRPEFQLAPAPQVRVNYHGRLDATLDASWLLAPADEGPGPASAPENPRVFPLDIMAAVVDRRLRLSVSYGAKVFAAESIGELVKRMEAELVEIAELSRAGEAILAPSDFPEADLSREELESVLDAID